MKTQMAHRSSAAIIALLSATSGIAQAQSLTWIGTLGGSASRAYAVSDDGSRVSGFSLYSGTGNQIPINWSGGVMTDLGNLGVNYGFALGISGDGSVVVGDSAGLPFRWSAGTMSSLTADGGQASGASYDGSALCGWMNTSAGGHAFLWTQPTGVQDIGTLGGATSWAKKLSDDGTIAIGRSVTAGGQHRAFRWTSGGGMQDLGAFGNMSDANGISPDGSVIVGWCENGAFRWTQSGGMQNIGIGLGLSCANAASNNGAEIVGWTLGTTTTEGVLWTNAGAVNMNTAFAGLLSTGSRIWEGCDISADGRYIVGYGWNGDTQREEGYILDMVPAPTSVMALIGGVMLAGRRRRAG